VMNSGRRIRLPITDGLAGFAFCVIVDKGNLEMD
jgi:hypothetical protein